ncbi:hypothetical protein B484DRAFT_452941 [Ochromonadaceae sp. CCMP2298]|nr:hypothetical protein B484DRAFT_452941 [Ochromonadaceae sp. CCMP2298]
MYISIYICIINSNVVIQQYSNTAARQYSNTATYPWLPIQYTWTQMGWQLSIRVRSFHLPGQVCCSLRGHRDRNSRSKPSSTPQPRPLPLHLLYPLLCLRSQQCLRFRLPHLPCLSHPSHLLLLSAVCCLLSADCCLLQISAIRYLCYLLSASGALKCSSALLGGWG